MSVEVSVIIPTFRRPAELRETLASVLPQADDKFEIIVVDDSPERSARDVVTGFSDSRVRYEPNPTPSNGWASAVRNYGIGFARGALVHFLDDDDMAPEGHYAAMKSAFAANPDVGVIFGRVEPFGKNADRVAHERLVFDAAAQRARASGRFGRKWAFSSRLFFSMTLLVCGAGMIRRSCIPSSGFDTTLNIAEDVDFYARAIKQSGACFVDRVTLRYRIWDTSLVHTPSLPATAIRDNYRRLQARYRREHGELDYLFTKTMTRTLLRVV